MSNFFAALDDSDNEGKAPSPAIAKKKSAPKKVVVEPSKVEKRPNKGDRHTKGGRSNRPPARDGKRTFDRKSGTGRGSETKKGGGGGHNWGSEKNDAKKAEGTVTEGNVEANIPEEPAAKGAEDAAVEEKVVVEEKEPEPEEPEEITISYEEYLAGKARPDSQAFQPVKEREVENEFAGKAAGAGKQTGDFLKMGGDRQPKKKGTGKNQKETIVLDLKFKKIQVDGGDDRGGDRGGRGGDRGGDRGGRGGDRGGDRGARREGGGGRREGGGERRERGGDRREGGGERRDRGGDRRGDRGNRGAGAAGASGGRGGGGGSKGLDTTDASAFPSL